MAYPHYLIEVPMVPNSASTANTYPAATLGQNVPAALQCVFNTTYNPTTMGVGQFAPLCIPHKVHRVGVRAVANSANPYDIIFYKRQEGGSTAWPTSIPGSGATGEMFRFMVPTIAATGKAIWKNVTGNYIVYPGEQLCCTVSTVLVSLHARINLLVSPVWEELTNVTQASRTTAP